jgi:predicted DNA-binding antitoxin AbrB/MazE fold protein
MVARNDKVEFEAVFENGVLRPVRPVTLTEHGRFVVTAQPLLNGSMSDSDRLRAWDDFFAQADAMQFRSDGPYPTRDELHERR